MNGKLRFDLIRVRLSEQEEGASHYIILGRRLLDCVGDYICWDGSGTLSVLSHPAAWYRQWDVNLIGHCVYLG